MTAAATVITERHPWGQDAHTALRWAFNLIEREPFPANLMAKMRTKSSGRGSGLSPLELRAEAARIRAMAQEQMASTHPLESSYVTAYYLPRPKVERKAGGGFQYHDQWIGRRRPAIRDLAGWLMRTATVGQKRLRGYEEVVAQHVYGFRHIHKARELLGVSLESAREFHGLADKELKDLRGRALTIMQGNLESAGML